MVLRADDERWGFISGWVDPGETPTTTVVREVREEVGLTVTDFELVDGIGRRAGRIRPTHGGLDRLPLHRRARTDRDLP